MATVCHFGRRKIPPSEDFDPRLHLLDFQSTQKNYLQPETRGRSVRGKL